MLSNFRVIISRNKPRVGVYPYFLAFLKGEENFTSKMFSMPLNQFTLKKTN